MASITAMKIRFILFDLDGTLVDSSRDLTEAVNTGLASFGGRVFTPEEIKRLVGEGVTRLVEKVFPEGDNAGREIVKERMLEHYGAHATRYSRPYKGIDELLQELCKRKLPLAVVSNKNEKLSRQVLDELNMGPYFQAVFGSDSAPERKPSPVPLIAAAARLGMAPGGGLMVGDSDFDILAGRGAGMKTCGVTWGFRSREKLKSVGADYLIDRPRDLPGIIGLDE